MFIMKKRNYYKTWAFILIVILFIILHLNYCTKLSRNFYIEQLNVKLDIEELEDGLYRIYIYRSIENKGKDYIDVNYRMSEMPSINLCFPIGSSNEIFVVERRYTEVNNYKSNDFNIIIPEINKHNYIELFKYNEWCDSVRSRSITLRVDAYLDGISIWDDKNNYIDTSAPIN